MVFLTVQIAVLLCLVDSIDYDVDLSFLKPPVEKPAQPSVTATPNELFAMPAVAVQPQSIVTIADSRPANVQDKPVVMPTVDRSKKPQQQSTRQQPAEQVNKSGNVNDSTMVTKKQDAAPASSDVRNSAADVVD